MTGLRIAPLALALALAVAGAVVRPRGLPAWAVPVGCVGVGLVTGALAGVAAGHALRPLAGAIAFLLVAVPLAALLDRAGVFAAAAARFGDGRALLPGLWVLAVATTAVLNLDAAVVLLTPLYVKVAYRVGMPAWYLGAQPLILSFLASSFLPVSNLTNLIAVAKLGIGSWSFLLRLGPPSVVACALGYVLYRRWGSRAGAPDPAGEEAAPVAPPAAPDPPPTRRPLALGAVVLAYLLVGFLGGPSIGLAPWVVALVADVALVVCLRAVPRRAVPWGTALVAGALALLASAVASSLPIASLLRGRGVLGTLETFVVGGAGANLVNNLPAFVIGLPFVTHGRSPSLWPLLLGVNMGPSLLVTGTLAALLWHGIMGAVGTPMTARQLWRLGVRVTLPAAVAAALVLAALEPLYR